MSAPACTNLGEVVRQESGQTVFLDNGSINVFEPYLKIQKLLGSSRVNIKYGSVAPLTRLHKYYSVIWLILMSIGNLQLIISYMARLIDNRKMFYLWTVGYLTIEIVFLGFLIHARFYDSESNINVYLKMQEIDRMMGTNRTIDIMLQKRNRRTAYLLALFFALFFLASYALANDEFGIIELLWPSYTLEIIVFEICCCSSHIRFFYTRMCQINYQISRHATKSNCDIEALSKGCESDLKFIKNAHIWGHCEATDICLKEIFNGFMLFKQQYRFQMLLFCALFVFWILFTFEHGILALQSMQTDKRVFLFDFIELASLALIYLVLFLWLNIGTEDFMREVRKTKHLAILIMCRYADGPLRTTGKNMLQLIEETPPSFSVYEMWSMNAQLIIDIFNIVTNFILTIIQFTFL